MSFLRTVCIQILGSPELVGEIRNALVSPLTRQLMAERKKHIFKKKKKKEKKKKKKRRAECLKKEFNVIMSIVLCTRGARAPKINAKSI